MLPIPKSQNRYSPKNPAKDARTTIGFGWRWHYNTKYRSVTNAAFFPSMNDSMARNSDVIFSESFLEMRAKLLEVAATLDRIDRAESKLSSDQQALRRKIDQAIEICASHGGDRAQKLQHLFSREFDPNWRSEMNV
jgi:hypothetical protein